MIKSFLLKTLHMMLRLHARCFKPRTVGVRAVIVNDRGQVLLIKHTYVAGWYLPGGGVNKGEDLIKALRRELKEEVNLQFRGLPDLLGTYANFFEGKSDYVSVFVVRDFNVSPRKTLEIADWGWYDPENLPADMSPGSQKRIAEFLGQRLIDYSW